MPTDAVIRAYTAETLNPAQYAELRFLPVSDVTKALDPSSSAVCVVRDAIGRIVAVAPAFVTVHADEFWITEALRGDPAVVRELLSGLFAMLRDQGLPQVLSVAPTDEIADYLQRLGGQEVGRLFVLPVPGA